MGSIEKKLLESSWTRKIDELSKECLAAIISSFCVAPAISIIDKSIIANASGRQPLLEGIKSGFHTLLFKPLYFIKQPSFLLIWGVYAGTYIVGNSIERICRQLNIDPFFPKFIGSSFANISLSVGKDRIFSRMFGKGSPRPLPLPSYMLFATRDSLTILAGFNLPSIISEHVQKHGFDKSRADLLSQLTVPCAIQFISSPMHLLGLDLYNRQNVYARDRFSFIRKEYFGTTMARIGRIFPAYGIGGVINKSLRCHFFEDLKNK